MNSISQNFGEVDSTKQTCAELEKILRRDSVLNEIQCGYWIFRGTALQKFANKKAFVILFGLVGLFFSATFAYFNGTITTLEKRYGIPSRNTGVISTGNDISSIFLSMILSYYASKRHRPRWIAIGCCFIVVFCLLSALPHFIYGPGEMALSLALGNSTETVEIEDERQRSLCHSDGPKVECERMEGTFGPQVILFLAQMVAGAGVCLYYNLGTAYMDDNVEKTQSPAVMGLTFFIRMLGPAFGYALASFCLRFYIAPELQPTITTADSRWLGAWWLGWLFLAGLLTISTFFLSLFPQTLPLTALRRHQEVKLNPLPPPPEPRPSLKDLAKTSKRLLQNKILMLNITSTLLYMVGYMPYAIFTPKYIETQYLQSAATANFVTGTMALVFSALGVLLSGLFMSHFRPSARATAAYCVLVEIFAFLGILSYISLGCAGADTQVTASNATACSALCNCDFVRFSPVCGADDRTYISACHAGCRRRGPEEGTFVDCDCVASEEASARAGACPVDCQRQFFLFIAVVCAVKFSGATGRVGNFIISIRCVEERDKTAMMGLGLTLLSAFALLPSPILFGWVLDRACLIWGQTCTSKGNCWLYDNRKLRLMMHLSSAAFIMIGALFDVGVWHYSKGIKLFDEGEPEVTEISLKSSDESDESKF